MSPSDPAVRSFLVDGRAVRVYDGLIDNVAGYVAVLAKAPFTRTEVARPETAGYRHWVSEIRLEALAGQPVCEQARRVVDGPGWPAARYRPYRAYTNLAAFGDMLFTHTDCLPGQGDLTALWYLCEDWDVEWGGETVFYDEVGELACSVRPRPGRLVVFDGAIRHAGRAPHRICYMPRYTMAIKFEPLRDGSSG